MTETRKFEAPKLLKDRRFWLASFLIVWAAGLQGHMMWLQSQDSFKHKFGELKPDSVSEEAADKQSFKLILCIGHLSDAIILEHDNRKELILLELILVYIDDTPLELLAFLICLINL
ncbi:hypothetical protein AAHA92_09772 [Salvia divinorum]|uniref:Uncharacterized protein n=1 Tax=Salvia divinorum TaxID=28513 RepID=A0ABD1HTC3_SALDI